MTTGITPPAQDGEALFGGEGLDHLLRLGGVIALRRQEGQADGVRAGRGKGESGRLRRADQEPVRHLDQDPRAVTGGDLGPRRPSMSQTLENGESLVDDVVIGTSVQIRHHAHAASVMFIRGVVETGGHCVLSDCGN